MVDEAIIFATKAHSGQLRKGTRVPYIVHPLDVMEIVSGIVSDDELLCAAVLHDTLEDTKATEDDILSRFGGRVLRLVKGDTENKRKHLPAAETWKLRKRETIEFLHEGADRDQKIIAFADKLSNLRALCRDFYKQREKVWNRFNCKDPMEQLWYFQSVLNECSELKELAEYAEYEMLIRKIWGS